jgi:alcohol dehydrogenase class IV
VVALTQSLKLPSLVEVGVRQADLSGLATLAESNVSNSSNPLPMTAADYADILELAMAEKLPEQGGEHQANK